MGDQISVVVVAHDMGRELPRTIRSLSPPYQQNPDGRYELIVVDNGSPDPVPRDALAHFPGRKRLERIDDALPSPARAANVGLEIASGDIIGLLIDGARIASPGLVRCAQGAARLSNRPVIATLGWHLGPATHMDAGNTGYDRAAEDRLLERAAWIEDGYALFGVSSLSGSSRRGWFGPLGESNALFTAREVWQGLGGLDEDFVLPGGGLVNHDLFARACALDDSELIVLLGEGTFHQLHGGASTSRRISRDTAFAEYERIRGRPYEPPRKQAVYHGHVPRQALKHLRYSVDWALRAAEPGPGG